MPKRLAVIGAGPIGIEAALRGVAKGWQVTVYEQETVGSHLLRWGHVRFFSQLKDNVSPLLLSCLPFPMDPHAYLTGREFVERVLRPVASSPSLTGKIREGTRVCAIGKRRILKTELPGHPLRADRPFEILLHSQHNGEQVVEADVVLDAGGVYGTPNWAGESGIPCPGERGNSSYFIRHLPDLKGRDKKDWTGKAIVVIGDGHSAATAIYGLDQLRQEDGTTHVTWVVSHDRARPCVEVANDPLPERKAIVARANDIAEHPPEDWKVFRKQSLLSVKALSTDWIQCTVGRGEWKNEIKAQKVLSLTGYRPDRSYLEELQLNVSPVTSGAGGLAQSLLSVTDCLAKIDVPPQKLESGEKNFYLVGHKSYGRLNNFLLRTGLEQLDLIFRNLGS
ncbi:MAG: hypothetical protein KCHDKBKB_02317 [Elusimicrobia bacterium]|nr:hypothetical protein [Elusimicrobiota bacterium]